MPSTATASSNADRSLSPTTQRITKAAFFRARSPGVPEKTSPVGDLAGQFDLSTRIHNNNNNNDGYRDRGGGTSSVDSHSGPTINRYPGVAGVQGYHHNNDGNGNGIVHGQGNALYTPSVGTAGHTPPLDMGLARNPTMSSDGPTSPRDLPTRNPAVFTATHTGSDGTAYEEDGYEASKESMGMGSSSDEMLMSLLAGQAAVDCDNLPIGGWEEVESWKKELSLMSNRLSTLVSRHQREVKILTAARTLQKLNTNNKRMSKQTMESLEHSEKRVEAAEKEVLVLREREAALRQRLMEHWSGVMAWEVRRLERTSSEAQARFTRQQRQVSVYKEREDAIRRQFTSLEDDLQRKNGRVEELEQVVEEMGRRERAIGDEIRQLDEERGVLEKDRQGWSGEKQSFNQERERWQSERQAFEDERRRWQQEKERLVSEKQEATRDTQRALDTGRMSDQDRMTMDRVRSSLGGLLGRKSGTVGEAEVVDAMDQVKNLVERMEKQITTLKDEMNEVNMGLEEEVRRIGQDRDAWKAKVDKAEAAKTETTANLERRLRQQDEQMSDLNLRNESLSTSLNAAQAALSSTSTSNESSKALQSKVDALTSELDSIASQFDKVWPLLPPPQKRKAAELLDASGRSNGGIVSPSRPLNFAALQQLYVPTNEKFTGMDELVSRIKGMAEDGKMLVERVIRCDREREVHKHNALKAKKLVEDSRHSLETYQQQVAVLEDRLAKSGSTESHFLDELNDLRSALDAASIAKKQAETQAAASASSCDRLAEVNDSLSARTLSLADEFEMEKKVLRERLQDDIDGLKSRLREAEEEADEARMAGQSQRIQLLDELNSLQAEVADLRKQLRAAQK